MSKLWNTQRLLSSAPGRTSKYVALHVRGILFDLVGVVLNALATYVTVLNPIRREFGLHPLYPDEVRQHFGRGEQWLVQCTLLADLEHAVAARRNLPALRDRMKHDFMVSAELFPEASTTLERLASQYKLGLITNTSTDIALGVLQTTGIAPLFGEYVVCSAGKPAPDGILELLSHMDVALDEAVLIGDSAPDFAAADAAGVTAVGCRYGYGRAEELPGPAAWIHGIEELPRFLGVEMASMGSTDGESRPHTGTHGQRRTSTP